MAWALSGQMDIISEMGTVVRWSEMVWFEVALGMVGQVGQWGKVVQAGQGGGHGRA